MTTTYVVMRGDTPVCTASNSDAAQAAAITEDTKHLGDRQREHRWDPTEWPVGALVLRTRSLSTGRWAKTGYTVVPVPHTA